ncbi:ubiquitin ligase [Tritrichomonas foetus]|uniref:HECT-type E3 ubiquitin transferase n=1 Tax=Tritrichomonas foetus TaxID=1144522 RepID=A0A1J4KZ48_9EUKA|nr:ubiquitin ligase [Tritrichomonas foetus]|eukprot:OHT16529.1 ubiquitin ligase [Tritrichomonas foetus]
MSITDPKAIIRGYAAQLTNGCNSCICTNEWCKSCEKFQFNFKDTKEALQKAVELAKNHVKENHLCPGLSHLQLDPTLATKASEFPKFADFNNLESLDKEKIFSLMKDTILLPHIFAPKEEFDDSALDNFAEIITNNEDFFMEYEEYLPTLTKQIISQNLETKEFANLMISSIFLFSLFPVNDLSDDFASLVRHVFSRKDETKSYIESQFSKIPKIIQRILSFIQDNLTYASISGEITDPQDWRIINLVFLVSMFRKAAPLLPSILFSNEMFTNQFMDKIQEINKYIGRKKLSFLRNHAILTLPFKFECLSEIYKSVQDSITRDDILRRIVTGGMNLDEREFSFYVEVSRESIVDDTVAKLTSAPPTDLAKRLKVVFTGEQGVDVGGVSREFFYLLCNELFSIKYGMFHETKNGKFWFVTPFVGRMIDFQALGIVVALAIYNSIILPIRFPQLLYKKICGIKTTLDDYEEIDPDIVQSLKSLRKMKSDGGNISDAGMTFSVTQDNYGQIVEIPLCEGGCEKEVTNDNLEEYIDLYGNWLMHDSIQAQFSKFETGFNKLTNSLKKNNQKIFEIDIYNFIHYDELDILVSGEEIIHWEVLKENCEYADGYNENSQQVKWFWEIFDEMTNNEKQQFFRFSTGSDRAPVGGLNNFKLVIQKTNDPTKLPVSHTCFNIFALPTYKSKKEMKQKILISIANTEGFGLI